MKLYPFLPVFALLCSSAFCITNDQVNGKFWNIISHNRCDGNFKQQLMHEMNRKRAIHMVPSFYLDEGTFFNSNLETFAQEMAEYHAGSRNSLPNSEELYGHIWAKFDPFGMPAHILVAQVLYEGARSYDWYGHEPPQALFAEYGTFTQMVWRESRAIAIGCADNEQRDWRYLVVAVRPPGNKFGYFAENVFPPSGRVSNASSGASHFNDDNADYQASSSETVIPSTDFEPVSTDFVSDPTGFVTDPTDFVTDPTDFVTDSTNFVSDSTDFVSDSTDFVTDPTGFVTDPTDFVSDSTDFVTDPTDFVTDPTDFVTGLSNVPNSTEIL